MNQIMWHLYFWVWLISFNTIISISNHAVQSDVVSLFHSSIRLPVCLYLTFLPRPPFLFIFFLFCLFYIGQGLNCSPVSLRTHTTDQGGIDPTAILLSQVPKHCDYRCEALHLSIAHWKQSICYLIFFQAIVNNTAENTWELLCFW